MTPSFRRMTLLALAFAAAALQPASALTPAEAEAILDKWIAPRAGSDRYVGFGVGCVAPGVRIMKGYGRIRHDQPEAPGPETVYEIGSITKTFTAIVLQTMIAEGLASLDTPVREWLPAGVSAPSFENREITLGDLTTQVSGLPRMPGNFWPKDPLNPYADYTPEKLYDALGKVKLKTAPGTKYGYSNMGVGLLGHAMTLKAGKDYDALLTERLLAPLGMTSTAVVMPPALLERLAPPYAQSGKPARNWDILTLAGAGGIRSSVADMTRFLEAQINPPDSPLGKAILAAQAPRFTVNRRQEIGMGWHIQIRPSGRRWIWHNGQTGGYHSFLGFGEDRKAGFFILGNTALDFDDECFLLADELMEAADKAGENKAAP